MNEPIKINASVGRQDTARDRARRCDGVAARVNVCRVQRKRQGRRGARDRELRLAVRVDLHGAIGRASARHELDVAAVVALCTVLA